MVATTDNTPPRSYTIASSDLRERLADVMLDVETGTTVIVTRYGRPVARIVPTEPTTPLDFSALRARMPGGGRSALELLDEEREKSR